jgi:hypothetical protein
MEIGPQHKGDVPFTARMRFHQSWYRANILSLPFGVGPTKNSKNKYGNMLTENDGNLGMNFLDQDIFQIAKERISERTGAVGEYRLLRNMLSSMPMCFNLFGPLKKDYELATKLISVMLPGEVKQVTNILFEFTPTPRKEYLNDRSAFDIFIEFITPEGATAFIGIEVKLTEPFSPKVHTNPRYDYWTAMENSPWKKEYHPELLKKDVNQLWRNHLLVQSLLNVKKNRYAKGFFMVIYHQEDLECKRSLDQYFTYLKKSHNVFEFSLDKIRELWRPLLVEENAKFWFDAFEKRYLALELSEFEFNRLSKKKLQ